MLVKYKMGRGRDVGEIHLSNFNYIMTREKDRGIWK